MAHGHPARHGGGAVPTPRLPARVLTGHQQPLMPRRSLEGVELFHTTLELVIGARRVVEHVFQSRGCQ